jgi:ABC-type phosphate transport system auxiliary subunit
MTKTTKKKTTTKKTTPKKKTSSSKKSDELNKIIGDATDVYTKTNGIINDQISRIEDALQTIRDAYSKESVQVPDKLNTYISNVNKLKIIQGRLNRHMDALQRDDTSIEKKASIISSMVEISNQIPSIFMD